MTSQLPQPCLSPVWNLHARLQSGDNGEMAELKGKFPNGLANSMSEKDIGVTELARLAGTSKQNVQRWRDQERRLPPEWAEKLAPLLDTTREALMFARPSRPSRGGTPKIPIPRIQQVPLFDKVGAGKLRQPLSQIVDVEDVPLLAFSDLGRGDWIALTVEGNSMDRVAPDGARIVLNRDDRTLVTGKAYVFSDRGEVGFKVWRPDPPRWMPFSTDPTHDARYVKTKRDAERMVVGRVKRSVYDL